MEYKLIIPGRLSGLNEYISAERTNRYKAAKLKADNEKIVAVAISKCLRGVKIEKPVEMHYVWVEKNTRRDKDNVAFARKFVQDSLVKRGVLKNDGWKYIVGFSDEFKVDMSNPHIEILIKEVK